MADERAPASENAGRVDPEVVAVLARSGIFKLWVPAVYGGGSATLAEGLNAIERAAFHDGSTGWAVMIANTTALLSASLPAAAAFEIFGGDDSICGGFAAPVGEARLVDEGFRVSGRWAWGSGSSHATTMGGGVRIVTESGAPGKLDNGGRLGFAFFDTSDVELLDTWQVAGLKATASTDYQVTDVIVPRDRIVALDRRTLVVDEPLYRFSTFGALALGVAMVVVGMARRAVNEFASLAEKVPQASSRSLAERSAAQAALGRADANVLAAASLVESAVSDAWATTLRGDALSDRQRVVLRLAANRATELAADATDVCYRGSGGSSVYLESPLQRIFRDTHVATQHAMVAERVYEPLGRHRFGLATDLRSL